MSTAHEAANHALAAAEVAGHHGAASGGGSLAEQLHHHWGWAVQVITGPFEALHHKEYLVMSVLVVVGLSAFFYWASRDLEIYPRRRIQSFLEVIHETLSGFVLGIVGPEGRRYIPLVGTVFIFVLVMNWIGLVPGLVSPTANLNVTVTMAVCVFLAVQLIAIYELGPKHYFLHLCGEPLWLAPLMFPIHVIGELAKPLSLAIRLFGNVFGEDQVLVNLAALSILVGTMIGFPLIPIHLPMLAFAVFTSFVQALVFAMLTAIYIVLFIGDHQAGDHGEAPQEHHS